MSQLQKWVSLIALGIMLAACQTTPGETETAPALIEVDTPAPAEEADPPPTDPPTAAPTEELLPTLTPTLAPWPPEPIDPWPAEAQAPWPTAEWSRSTPEEQGIDSQVLVDFLRRLQGENIEYHSLLVIRNGYLVLEDYQPPWEADQRHVQFSVTKSLTSLLVGLAIEDGYMAAVDQPVFDYFPDLAVDDRAEKDALTVEDLLTMRDGLTGSQFDPQDFLSSSLSDPPGTFFQYDNGPPRFLAALADQLLPTRAVDYAQARIFEPLGISPEEVSWGTVAGGAPDGGTGLSMTPRAMARIGYLYLNHGLWDGQQIVSADWVEQSTIQHVTGIDWHDIDLSYGYFWWLNPYGRYYAANGHGGQMIVVLPAQNVVIVITGDDQVHIPPVIAEFSTTLEVAAEPLPENPDALAALEALIDD